MPVVCWSCDGQRRKKGEQGDRLLLTFKRRVLRIDYIIDSGCHFLKENPARLPSCSVRGNDNGYSKAGAS